MSIPAGVDPGSRLGRRAALRRRRRQRRRTAALVALALLLVAAAAVTVLLVDRGGKVGRLEKIPVRTQRTLLLQVRGPRGDAVVSALLADDPVNRTGAVVLVPPQTITTVPGVGTVPFSQGLRASSPNASRNALADLLGITVDGGWVLDGSAFVRLVDAEGGISVTVDTTVLSGRTVLLSPGAQRVDGLRALSYASYLAAGEQEQARLSRLQQVLDGMLTALPADPTTLLASLGPASTVTLGVPGTAALLAGLKGDDQATNLQYRSLPVVKIDTGGDAPAFRVDAPTAQSLVDELLAQSIPAGARSTGNRVLVLNGVGTPGLGEQVRARLVPAGFVFVGARNAEHLGYTDSQVLIRDATPASLALGSRLATALRLPASAVRTSDSLGSVSDVVVLVGSDFRP